MSGDGGRSLREVLGIRYLSTSPADISVFGRDSTRSRFALLDPTRALAAMSTPVSTGAGDRQRRHRATPLNPGSFGPRGVAPGRGPRPAAGGARGRGTALWAWAGGPSRGARGEPPHPWGVRPRGVGGGSGPHPPRAEA